MKIASEICLQSKSLLIAFLILATFENSSLILCKLPGTHFYAFLREKKKGLDFFVAGGEGGGGGWECFKGSYLASAKSEAPDKIYSLFKENIKSCNTKGDVTRDDS